jgi:PAS domain S-box-containing protein
VLYVADEPELLTLGKIFLEQSGDLKVDTAISAQKALSMLENGSYDAVASEFMMPGMDGIRFLKQVRAGRDDLPFILITGRGSEDAVIGALNNRADYYLRQGSDTQAQFAELRHTITKAVERQESDIRFRMLMEESAAGAFIIEGDCFLHVNQRLADLFGYSVEEIITTLKVSDLVSPRDRERVAADLEVQVSDKGTILHSLFSGRRKDGREIRVEMAGTRSLFHNRHIIIGTIRDAGKTAGPENTSLPDHRKDTLFNMVVRHDIANRLTALRGRLKLIRKQYDDPALLNHLEKIDRAGRDIYLSLESVRKYHELGSSAPHWQDVEGMLAGVQETFETITVHLSPEVRGLELYADPLCGRVFANLFDNTLRHGVRATEIRISCRMSDERVVIIWEDNGVGVPAHLKERIFEQGYGANTGLGLYLCREILSETGISLSENGVPGSGVRFEITVPKGAWRNPVNPLGLAGDREKEKTNMSS